MWYFDKPSPIQNTQAPRTEWKDDKPPEVSFDEFFQIVGASPIWRDDTVGMKAWDEIDTKIELTKTGEPIALTDEAYEKFKLAIKSIGFTVAPRFFMRHAKVVHTADTKRQSLPAENGARKETGASGAEQAQGEAKTTVVT